MNPQPPLAPAPRDRRASLARRRAQIRRRRLTALAVAGALVGLVVLLLSGGGGNPAQRTSGGGGPTSHPSPAAPPTLTARENAAIDRLLIRQPFIISGGGEHRQIALTFDDGPGPYTPALLDQLERLRVPATFFEIGSMIHYFHSSLERQLSAGYVIGDHTELHPMMAHLSPSAQEKEIVVQTQWMHKYGGAFPRLYRPPYGSFNQATLAILKRLHMLMVLWTIDTEDFAQPGVSAIVHRVLAGARPGAIVLMHDGGGTRTQTIEALPLIVGALRSRGYQFVSVPQLILTDPPQRPQALPRALAGG